MYSEQDRRIFGPYFNGLQSVYGDPLQINRRLVHALDGDPAPVHERANSQEEAERFEAREKLVVAARYAFGMVEFNPTTGQGAVELDVWTALNSFLEWREKKDSTAVTLPTSQPLSDSSASEGQAPSLMTPTSPSFWPSQGFDASKPGQ